MATRHKAKQIPFHNENLHVPLKITAKKRVALGNRKALNDITNKSTAIHRETSSRKKNLPKEEIDVSGEALLHDHQKCIESKNAMFGPHFILETLLPGHDCALQCTSELKGDCVSPCCYPEPDEELLGLLNTMAPGRGSPLGSSPDRDLLPGFPTAWEFEAVEFVLKPGADG